MQSKLRQGRFRLGGRVPGRTQYDLLRATYTPCYRRPETEAGTLSPPIMPLETLINEQIRNMSQLLPVRFFSFNQQ